MAKTKRLLKGPLKDSSESDLGFTYIFFINGVIL
jgi:hypothetical protein